MPSDSSDIPAFRRRYLLRTLGAVGAGALAGCAGDNGSDGSEPGSGEDEETDANSTPGETSTPKPDYSLPESEHVSPVDMATEWMIFPDDQGDDLEAVALSPSKLSENYDASFTEDIGAHHKYRVFEFSHSDIPETYVQKAIQPWDSELKVDQLPNNVSEDDVTKQLADAGYSMQHQRGDFEVYRGDGDFHAVGEDRHITILGGSSASTSQMRDLMFRVIEETNENRYELPDTIQEGLESIDSRDSITINKTPGIAYMPSVDSSSIQPELAISSVDFEEGKKYGAWPFEDRQSAENAVTILESQDLRDGYNNPRQNGKTVVASGADYQLDEMNFSSWLNFSDPRI